MSSPALNRPDFRSVRQVSTDPRWATGDSVRGSGLAGLPRVACPTVALDVIVG
jgi:hypothetical protein